MNRLKLIICFLTVALCGLTGCQEGQTDWIPVNIGFKPYIGHDTRAIVESVPFPEERSFKVWAVDHTQSMYIDGEVIEYDGSGWNSAKIWPRTDLSLEACWPTDIGATFTSGRGISIEGFDTTRDEVDILCARAYDVNYTTGRYVTLEFDHILSRVEFRMRQSLSSQMAVKVKRIELNGFAKTGDYNKSGNYAWTTTNPSHSYVFDTSDEPVIVGAEPIYLGEDFYAIPQSVSATVIVDFEVKFGEANWIPLQEEIQNFVIDWMPGTHYTYTLNLTEATLTYTTGISNWNNRAE